MSDRRWNVEVRHNVFEDVGAHSLALDAGCLVFMTEDDELAVAYAAGTWLTVTPEETS